MAPSGKYVVAAVDDDSRVLKSLGLLLESAGYEVRLYASAEALLKVDGGLAELDCLISDIDMPIKDGFELQRTAKAAMPRLPVILITGRHDLAVLARTAGDRAEGLFQKPFSAAELLDAVSKAVEGSSRN